MGSDVFVWGLNRAGTSLVQCRERDDGSGVFVKGLNKGRNQPASVQGARWGLRSVCRGLEQGRPQPGSVQGEMQVQECLSGAGLTQAGGCLLGKL